MTRLRAYCDACHQQITPLRAGLLEVDLAAVDRVEAARAAWERDRGQVLVAADGHLLGHTYSGADLLDYREAVPWRVWHRRCDPDPHEEHGAYYHLTLDRIADPWDQLIRAAAEGHGPLRCTPARRSR
jgi:hypothetical protein